MIDLLVAGGGPVGMATALYAAQRGLSVAIAEPRKGPIDKACGEGLMPGAVSALGALGIDVSGRAFRGIRYTDGRRTAEAAFSSGPGLGVRRLALYSSLLDAVERHSVHVLPVPVDRVETTADSVRAAGVTARYLAAADGLHSPVRRMCGLDLPAQGPRRFGLRRHYAVQPWTDLVEVHWGPDCEAYVTPVGEGLVGVAILTGRRGTFEGHLRAFPRLRERLPDAAATTTRAAGPLRQRSRARTSGRVLLVGDAAGYVDALTGEGLAIGLASARALVDSVAADDPRSYEQGWLEATRRYRRITEALLWARNRPRLAGAIVPAASRLPRVVGSEVNALER